MSGRSREDIGLVIVAGPSFIEDSRQREHDVACEELRSWAQEDSYQA